MPVLVKLQNVKAPDARMHKNAASAFGRLRADVLAGSGFDFLGTLGDVFRPENFKSSKDGVADRSWHKTGRAFDYDQTSKALVLVAETKGGKQYWRTWLRCAKQDGSQGEKRTLRDTRGGSSSGWHFDFTAAAESIGWQRIPAWSGWQKSYNRREFWHYQFTEGLTWEAAMATLRGAVPTAAEKVTVSLNDRDRNTNGRVSKIQAALSKLGLLPASEIDGVFGSRTFAAVIKFQRSVKLKDDGIVGPNTLKALKL